jgi:hypothetical protein
MKLMHLIYRTKTVANKFKKDFDENNIVLIEPTKLLITKNFTNEPQKLNWILSTRTVTILTDRSIFFNKKKLDINEIKEVKIFLYKTFLGLVSYQVF